MQTPRAQTSVELEPGAIERAAFAVSRSRIARAARLRAELDAVWPPLLQLAPAILLVVLATWNPDVPRHPFLALPFFVLIGVLVIQTGILGPFAAWRLARAAARMAWFAPWWSLRRAIALRAEWLLARNGRLPGEWYGRSRLRRAAVEHLVSIEPELVRDEAGVRALTARVSLACGHCGALLRSTGPGLRRCDYCGTDRYEPLPARSSALDERRPVGLADTLAPAKSRWRMFADSVRDTRLAGWWLITRAALATALVLLPPAFLLQGTRLDVVGTVLFGLGALGFVVGACGLAWCADALFKAWLAFRPGLVEYDELLQEEVLEAVAHQGRIALDALAHHLRITRRHLTRVVAMLGRRRALALYHDRENGLLLSSFARWHGDSRCKVCGGHVVAARGAGLRCEHCGSPANLEALRLRATGTASSPRLVEGPPVVTLALDDGRTQYRGGDVVRGHAVVSVSSPRRCDVVLVRLSWAAHGTQESSDHVVVHEELRLHEHGELVGEHRFDFAIHVPDAPPTLRGPGITVDWTVTARVKWPDERDTVRTEDVTVEPRRVGSRDEVVARAIAHASSERRVRTARGVLGKALYYGFYGFIALVGLGFGIAGLAGVALAFASGHPIVGLAGLAFVALVARGAFELLKEHDLVPRLGRAFRLDRLEAPTFVLRGETFEASCRLAIRPGARLALVQWELRCRRAERSTRSVQTRHGRRLRYEWQASWTTIASGLVKEASGPGEVPLVFRASVPASAPASLYTDSREVTWRLVVKASGGQQTGEAAVELEVLPYELVEAERASAAA